MLTDIKMDIRTDIRSDIWTDARTDGHTDGRTERPSYRDARTHLKKHRLNSDPIIHFPSEGVSKVSEQANE